MIIWPRKMAFVLGLVVALFIVLLTLSERPDAPGVAADRVEPIVAIQSVQPVPTDAIQPLRSIDSTEHKGATYLSECKGSRPNGPSLASLLVPRCTALISGGRAVPPAALFRSMVFLVPRELSLLHAERFPPPCPTQHALLHLDESLDNDTNVDQRASHILFKYNYYVTRCNRTQGIMWKHMTLPVMREVTKRVVTLLCDLLGWRCNARIPSSPPTPYALPIDMQPPAPAEIRLLDWASGCGAGTQMLYETLASQFEVKGRKRTSVSVLGVDIMDAGVAYARANYGAASPRTGEMFTPGATFCHADGTKLNWISDGQLDAITSFGGLLHLPSSVMCSTVQQLLRKLKPGGAMWAGYIDSHSTAESLAACTASHAPILCPSEGTLPNSPRQAACATVQTTILRENAWFKGTGMPRVYRRKKPFSIVWHLSSAEP